MKKCLYSKCEKEFEPTKPKQKFCCAVHKTYWHRENKPFSKTPLKSKTLTMSTNRVIVSNLTKPLQNESINTTRPKNLMELKELCPFKEIGDERSVWIATERQKYNI